jgi:phosphomevalonate kinase
MWGRITQIAEKLDDTFGTEEGGESNNNSSSNGGDGWDEGDDFADEDLEFDDDWGNNDQVPADEDELPEAPLASEVDPETLVENGDAPVFEQTNGDAAVSLAQDAPPLDDRVVTVSAPGKALIAGGYLVLESPNPGVVIAAKGCKFYSTVAFRPTFGGASVANNGGGSFIPVDVYSPQFDQVFTYKLSYSQNNSDITLGVRNDGPSESPRNKFIERTLLLTIGYIRTALGDKFTDLLEIRQPNTSLAIKLRADNDFYSQLARLREMGLDPTPQNVHKLDPFLCPIDKASGSTEVNKTGLGSSAALVTSLVGAMLEFFEVTTLAETEGLTISHNLAQICHCYSQGKVGSGFDVSSAVYGSHVYTRFSKSLIRSLLVGVDKLNTNGESLHLSDTVARDLLDLVNDTTKQWDCTVTPFALPKDLEIIMADICGGSESPSMASKVLEWKKNNRKVGFLDDYFWKNLKRCNSKIASLLTNDFTCTPVIGGLERDGAQILANRTAEQWKKPMPSTWHEFEGSSWYVAGKLLDLRMALLESRQNLKGMGNAAGVPIEPDVQTKLANATMKLPGVIAAGVPGAGGYDALFVLYVKGEETSDGFSDKVRDNIGDLWNKMSSAADDEIVVCPLNARAAGYGGQDGLCVTNLEW